MVFGRLPGIIREILAIKYIPGYGMQRGGLPSQEGARRTWLLGVDRVCRWIMSDTHFFSLEKYPSIIPCIIFWKPSMELADWAK